MESNTLVPGVSRFRLSLRGLASYGPVRLGRVAIRGEQQTFLAAPPLPRLKGSL